jgi:hypothetical protein
MDKNPFGVFKSEDDYVNWDKYYEQLDLIELTEPNRGRARKSISYLRKLLGEDFLRIARQQGTPILPWFFMNAAPRARLSLISFAEALDALEKADKFSGLVDRIKDAGRVGEALTVLDAAYKFRSTGFCVCFDPDVMVADKHGAMKPKTPDLKLTDRDTGEVIFVEVSRLMTGAKQNQLSRTHDVIWHVVHTAVYKDPRVWEDLLNPKYVLPYVRIKRGLDEGELRAAAGKVEEVILDVITTQEYREDSFRDMLEIAVSPAHDHSRARGWAAAREMRDWVECPPIPLNEINRAKGKIFDELHQLPDDKPGIVLVPASSGNLLFFVYNIRAIVLELEKEVARHPKLFCAVVSHSFTDAGKADEFAVAFGQHVICSKKGEDLSTEQAVIIHNGACAMPVAASTAAKIRRAFTNGYMR